MELKETNKIEEKLKEEKGKEDKAVENAGIKESKLLVGIDLSLKTNHVVIVNNVGLKLASFSIENNLTGAKILRDKLLNLVEDRNINVCEIGMEATNIYWWHLHQFLLGEKILNSVCKVRVYTINPKLIKKFKGSFSKLNKTDPIDAYVIAERVRFGNLTESAMIDETFEPLKRLTRFRFHLIENLISEKNYLLTNLFFKYSSWQSVKPFSSAFGKTATEIISEMDMEEVARLPIGELAEKVTNLSNGTMVNPQKAAELLKKVAEESYVIKDSFETPVDLILTNTYENIKYFQGKIKSIDGVIEKEYQRSVNTLTSIPGIGLVFAAGITGEIGNINHYRAEKHLASYAGLTWSKFQSGEFTAEETHVKQGNQYLRYYLVQAANSLRIHNEEYKDYYRKKYDEVSIHKHKRALVLTARKLVRLIYAMLRDQRLYNPENKERIKKT
jgi:transposase